MKWAVAGRKIAEDLATGVASTRVTRMGVVGTVSTLSPACAVAQIEQAWREVLAFSGCACTACATAIVHTRAIASRPTALMKTLRFADVFAISLGCAESTLCLLDDFILKWLCAETRRGQKSEEKEEKTGSHLPLGRLTLRAEPVRPVGRKRCTTYATH